MTTTTTEQIHRILAEQTAVCRNPRCRRDGPVLSMTLGHCPPCHERTAEIAERDRQDIQDRLMRTASRLEDMLPENSPLAASAKRVLNAPETIRTATSDVSRVLAFAYDYAKLARDSQMTGDVLLIKSRL